MKKMKMKDIPPLTLFRGPATEWGSTYTGKLFMRILDDEDGGGVHNSITMESWADYKAGFLFTWGDAEVEIVEVEDL